MAAQEIICYQAKLGKANDIPRYLLSKTSNGYELLVLYSGVATVQKVGRLNICRENSSIFLLSISQDTLFRTTKIYILCLKNRAPAVKLLINVSSRLGREKNLEGFVYLMTF